MDIYIPYALMFVGGALTSIFDIHSKSSVSVLRRQKGACAGFALIMGFVGVFFFWCIRILGVLNPQLSPLVASIVLFVGYRVLIQSNMIVLKFGNETKEIGLSWLYDGFMFLFFDLIKGRETTALESRFMSLPTPDLVCLAESICATQEDRNRINKIAGLTDETFKKSWLANYCAKNEAKAGSAFGKAEDARIYMQ
jgi:apolipoprotein N-acyltransferase